jgi:signal transduction histidine kinase
MSVIRPAHGEVALALLCAAWAAAFLVPDWPTAVVSAPLVGLAVLPHRRRPAVAALALAGLLLLSQWLAGTPSENPWPIAAVFVVTYALGRHAEPASRGAVPLAVLALALVAADPALPTIVFGFVLLGSVWGFGYLVRWRSSAASRATAASAELAAVDPTVRAEQVVAEERARLAGDALAVVRGAVTTMQRHAGDADADLDPATLEAIQVEGRRAIRELRRLLGLLRSEPEADSAPPDATPQRRVWPVDLATAVAVAVFAVLEILVDPSPVSTTGVALAILLAAPVALRRTDPALACVLAVLSPAVALAFAVPLPLGLWTAVVAVLLAWSATADGRPRGYVALGTFAVVLLLAVQRGHPGNEAMMLAVIGLAATAGHLWAARGREERSATAAAARLRAEHEKVAEMAVRAERLRLARDLHDVVSHAVGVMVLQAGAAAALRTEEPARAREAVRAVHTAGTQALSELEILFGLLDGGAVGVAGVTAQTDSTDLAGELEALVERMRGAGLRVSLATDERLPVDREVAATAYRVVQEALTNAARYAPGSDVEVRIRMDATVLDVTVRDVGPRTASAAPSGGGFGLVGLAERVRAHGGDLTTGPRPEGGFVVSARLPTTAQTEVRS